MAIIIDDQRKVFTLQTKNSIYQMRVALAAVWIWFRRSDQRRCVKAVWRCCSGGCGWVSGMADLYKRMPGSGYRQLASHFLMKLAPYAGRRYILHRAPVFDRNCMDTVPHCESGRLKAEISSVIFAEQPQILGYDGTLLRVQHIYCLLHFPILRIARIPYVSQISFKEPCPQR